MELEGKVDHQYNVEIPKQNSWCPPGIELFAGQYERRNRDLDSLRTLLTDTTKNIFLFGQCCMLDS